MSTPDDDTTNSDEVRRIVGLIVAGKTPTPIMDTVRAAPHWVMCDAYDPQENGSPNFEFYAKQEVVDGQKGLGFYFTDFLDKNPIGTTRAFVRGLSLDDFTHARYPSLTAVAQEGLFNHEWNVEIEAAPAQPGSPEPQFRISAWPVGTAKPASSWAGSCSKRGSGGDYQLFAH